MAHPAPRRWYPITFTVAALLLLPLSVLLLSWLEIDREIWSHLWDTQLPRLLGNTLTLVLGVGIGVTLLGVSLAWLTSLCEFPGRRWLDWALMLPFAIPAYVLAFVFVGLLDFAGPVQSLLREWFGSGLRLPRVRSTGGVILVLVLVFYPYVYLLARSAFIAQGKGLMEAARVLGLSPWQAFLRVALPMARPAIGAGLALVGAALQAVTRNPLADPHLLGATSGATLGAVLVVLYIGEVIGLLTLPLAAFLGALGSMLLVLGVASRGGRLGSDRLLLAGVAVSFVLLALANLLLFLGDHRAASSVLFWMLGGLGLARWSLIWLPALCVAGGLLVLLGLGRALNALMAGEQTAVTLGLDARRVRLWVFVCCSLLTGVLVSVSGAIGFVGLMLPHAARLLVGAEHRRLLPVCALLGALFLVWMDVAARTLIAPQDLPIGIATAAIGGLFFILLLRRRS